MKTKKWLNLNVFYIRFDEEWKVMGKCYRTKGYEPSKGSKLGKT